jgi:tetratricopeptide (TPR) repeat protein
MTLQEMADRAVALHQQGHLAEAERLYAEVLLKAPGNVELLFNHGAVLQGLNRAGEALRQFDSVVSIRPANAAAWNGRGAALAQAGRPEQALASFERALALRPDDSRFLFNRGMVLMVLARFDAALETFDRVVATTPDYPDAWNNRGNSLKALGRFDEALSSFERAASLSPHEAGLHLNRGLALTDLARFEEALDAFDVALAIDQDYAEAINNRGLVLQYLGRGEEARSAYERALQIAPTMAAAYLNLAAVSKFTLDDPRLAAMEALHDRGDVSDPTGRIQLDFALAKAYEDVGRYGRSFEYLLRGNRLHRARIHYDEADELRFFDRIEEVFTEDQLHSLKMADDRCARQVPIFIVGMPRSGSTLIEQILASHPNVYGAGELAAIRDAIGSVRNPASAPYPELALNLDPSALRQLASHYFREIGERGGGATHVADKLPSNYYYVGLIHAALPGARIIHTVRDPLDTCFSRFAKLFIDQQAYCYDLVELGRYYRRYESLMMHWRRVLPAGAMIDVHYEDVVNDLEGQARRLIAYCGLDWDDRCLSFYTARRPVKTPSAFQVRQPIYRNAIGRAAPFDQFLGPLKAALERG